MKHKHLFFVSSAMALTCMLPARATNFEQWVGVWEGQFNDRPGVTVTLGNDAGDLQGTIVFNFFGPESTGEAHVVGHDAHVLTHTNFNEGALTFQAKQGDSRELHFSMKLTGAGKAVLDCTDCGEAAAIELNRIH